MCLCVCVSLCTWISTRETTVVQGIYTLLTNESDHWGGEVCVTSEVAFPVVYVEYMLEDWEWLKAMHQNAVLLSTRARSHHLGLRCWLNGGGWQNALRLAIFPLVAYG